MCGRYYLDDETAKEMERQVKKMDGEEVSSDSVRKEAEAASGSVQKKSAGDVYPSQRALILAGMQDSERKICVEQQIWGFPGFSGKQVIFNARAESAMEKKMFRDSVLQRRCIIPASWFYEWDYQKNKVTFVRKDGDILFFAGFFQRYPEGERFIILTTAANTSMQTVHDRMPLILEREELTDWIFQKNCVKKLLQKVPCVLEKRQDYKQEKLPFL